MNISQLKLRIEKFDDDDDGDDDDKDDNNNNNNKQKCKLDHTRLTHYTRERNLKHLIGRFHPFIGHEGP